LIDHPFADQPGLAPADYLASVGTVFERFDSRTQDSGNVSFGVEAGGRRWFVKSAGDPQDRSPFLSHAARVALLENAQALARSVRSPALPALAGSAWSAWGPMLVYEWAAGELVHAPAERRDDPASAFRRFRSLPPAQATAAIDATMRNQIGQPAAWISENKTVSRNELEPDACPAPRVRRCGRSLRRPSGRTCAASAKRRHCPAFCRRAAS